MTQCDLQLDYSDETLTLSFLLATPESVVWSAWLSFKAQTKALWSVELPATESPTAYEIVVPEFPPVGTIGFLTTFVNQEGIVCSDWATVDTGVPDSPIQLGQLLGLFMRQGFQVHLP